MSRLELVGVRKSFGAVRAVDGVDLDVGAGDLFTLLGPSGSGKTTILRLVAGFERADGGRILLDGRDVASLPPARRGIGLVFQHYALFPHMTVAQNVEYALKLRRRPRRERRQRVQQMLALVRLEGLEGRRPSELSGGQQQRVALARALVFGPHLLLMDEPLGALDRALRATMQNELRRIHRETGVTVLYVTHDQQEALALSDRVGVLDQGRLLQRGTPGEVFDAPQSAVVARFVGDCNLFALRQVAVNGTARWALDGVGARSPTWDLPPGGGSRWLLMVRPRRVVLDAVGPPPGETTISLAARVDDVIYLGDSTRVHCTTSELGSVVGEVDAASARRFAPGEAVVVSFSAADSVPVPGRDA